MIILSTIFILIYLLEIHIKIDDYKIYRDIHNIMSRPLNPLVVARLRKYWLCADIELDELLYILEGWIHILGPGPYIPRCDNCEKDLSLNWKICTFCPKGSPAPLCPHCYQCFECEGGEGGGDGGDACCMCGDSCGAYMCSTCKASDY